MTLPAQFDRDLTLAELLRATPRPQLESALCKLLGAHWHLADVDGTVLFGPGVDPTTNTVAAPIRIDIEVVGKLIADDGASEHVTVASAVLDMAFASAVRYLMSADLHLEAMHADYEALRLQHAALQESETRYRELSEQLEQRVKEQVDVIERAQRQLYQAEKMASVGSLAAGMAHEINNPVGFIRSNLTTANDYLQRLDSTLRGFHHGDVNAANIAWTKHDIDFVLKDFPGLLEESIAGTDRIARIVANLKAYASIDCTTAMPLDLNDAVRAVAAVVSDQLPSNISLETDLRPLPMIICDQSRINQMLFALVQNARQSMEHGGVIRVASAVTDNEVRISVKDHGCGIDAGILNRIFDPFFTTRDVGKGMGLGLTISRDIVNAHQGYIDVNTVIGIGSTFTVCLPIVQSNQSEHPS